MFHQSPLLFLAHSLFSPNNHLAFSIPEPASSTPIPTPTPNPKPTHLLQSLPAPLHRSKRPRRQNVYLDRYDLCVSINDFDICMIATTSSIPEILEHDTTNITFAQANKDLGWRQAMTDKMTSIWNNATWILEPLPWGTCAITCKWVFKLRPAQGDQPPKKKAGFVPRGFQQHKGINFSETFASIITWATIHTAITLATAKCWTIHHMDVRTAFLNNLLKE